MAYDKHEAYTSSISIEPRALCRGELSFVITNNIL